MTNLKSAPDAKQLASWQNLKPDSYPHDKILNLHLRVIQDSYRIDPKFLDRNICANSVDLDQTAPEDRIGHITLW